MCGQSERGDRAAGSGSPVEPACLLESGEDALDPGRLSRAGRFGSAQFCDHTAMLGHEDRLSGLHEPEKAAEAVLEFSDRRGFHTAIVAIVATSVKCRPTRQPWFGQMRKVGVMVK
jgi:hypothetical protein